MRTHWRGLRLVLVAFSLVVLAVPKVLKAEERLGEVRQAAERAKREYNLALQFRILGQLFS